MHRHRMPIIFQDLCWGLGIKKWIGHRPFLESNSLVEETEKAETVQGDKGFDLLWNEQFTLDMWGGNQEGTLQGS